MDHDCTVRITMEYLSKKWAIMILLELYKGEQEWKRFTQIRDMMKEITPKVLSERLKELEKEELIIRKVDATSFPVKSEYKLTEMGIELVEAVKVIKNWALKWKVSNHACKEQDCKICIL